MSMPGTQFGIIEKGCPAASEYPRTLVFPVLTIIAWFFKSKVQSGNWKNQGWRDRSVKKHAVP